jgi:hypothetical protein
MAGNASSNRTKYSQNPGSNGGEKLLVRVGKYADQQYARGHGQIAALLRIRLCAHFMEVRTAGLSGWWNALRMGRPVSRGENAGVLSRVSTHLKSTAMDIEQAIKKIRTYIKFGRVVRADEELRALLNQFSGTQHEAVILEVYALELQMATSSYAKANPLLIRLLSLNISEELRKRALDCLARCEQRLNMVPVEADLNNPNLTHFMETLRNGHIFKFNAHPNSLHRHPLTRDLEVAKMLAWHQGIESPFRSWNGLRSKASLKRNIYRDENKINIDLFSKIVTSEISFICENKICGDMMHFFDDIFGDLSEIAEGKAIGYETGLHKQMWEVYKRGAFPCGWKDDGPDEKVCIFIPISGQG